MNKELRKNINEFAYDVRKALDLETPVDDMCLVVERLGGKVIDSEKLQFGTSELVKKGAISFEIRVSAYADAKRKRLIIAYELGHLFLHMGYIINKDKWASIIDGTVFNVRTNWNSNFEAREFAESFLIPKEEYSKKVVEYTKGLQVGIDKISEDFDVTIEAAINRGKWLGYLCW